jgi:hypothetical protein
MSECGYFPAGVQLIIEDGIAEMLRQLAPNLMLPARDYLHAHQVAPQDIRQLMLLH